MGAIFVLAWRWAEVQASSAWASCVASWCSCGADLERRGVVAALGRGQRLLRLRDGRLGLRRPPRPGRRPPRPARRPPGRRRSRPRPGRWRPGRRRASGGRRRAWPGRSRACCGGRERGLGRAETGRRRRHRGRRLRQLQLVLGPRVGHGLDRGLVREARRCERFVGGRLDVGRRARPWPRRASARASARACVGLGQLQAVLGDRLRGRGAGVGELLARLGDLQERRRPLGSGEAALVAREAGLRRQEVRLGDGEIQLVRCSCPRSRGRRRPRPPARG